MKNNTIYIGLGVVALAVIGFIYYKKKGGGNSTTEEEDAKAVADAKQNPTNSDEAADEAEAEKIAEEIESLPDTPEGKKRKLELGKKLTNLAMKTPLAKIIRLQREVGKKVFRSVKGGVANIGNKTAERRRCGKEADDKFGFPLKRKKIEEKVKWRKQCKNEGGADFAFNFSEEHNDVFNNGQVF